MSCTDLLTNQDLRRAVAYGQANGTVSLEVSYATGALAYRNCRRVIPGASFKARNPYSNEAKRKAWFLGFLQAREAFPMFGGGRKADGVYCTAPLETFGVNYHAQMAPRPLPYPAYTVTQDGRDFYSEETDELLWTAPFWFHDFDDAGATRARQMFAAKFPRHTLI